MRFKIPSVEELRKQLEDFPEELNPEREVAKVYKCGRCGKSPNILYKFISPMGDDIIMCMSCEKIFKQFIAKNYGIVGAIKYEQPRDIFRNTTKILIKNGV